MPSLQHISRMYRTTKVCIRSRPTSGSFASIDFQTALARTLNSRSLALGDKASKS